MLNLLSHSGGMLAAIVATCCLSCSRSDYESQPDSLQPDQRKTSSSHAVVTPDSEAKVVREPPAPTNGPATREKEPSVASKESTLVADTDDVARITTATDEQWLTEMQRDMDPSNDGWDTESFAEAANLQLKHVGELIVGDSSLEEYDFSNLLADGFRCSPLRPGQLQTAYREDSIVVLRPESLPESLSVFGPEGLVSAIHEVAAGLEGARQKYFKFKLYRVFQDGQQFETKAYFELAGRYDDRAVECSATWVCRWQADSKSHAPILLSIAIEDYEEVEVRGPQGTLYSDCTEDIFRDTTDYDEQFRPDIDYWRARLENYLSIYYDGLHGVALGDVNGDGLDDVYFCEPGGLPNRLFVQRADGLLRDVSASSGLDFLNSTRTALFVDLDNDGDQDLVTPMQLQIQFYSNDGKGHFTRELTLPFEWESVLSLAAADYDEDGYIDIYACFYHGLDEKESNRTPAPIPYHDSRSGGFNRLIRNEGNWNFRDVTNEVGLDHNNDRWSFAAVWEDFDNDGDQDIYVSNDFGRNNLYIQQEGKFRDMAGPSGAEDMNFGMSAAAGDYDRDGRMDIYVSNMFSSAGGRITYQPDFQSEGTREAIAAFQRMADGNTLLRNNKDGSFADVSSAAHVGVGRWAWGSLFADINNDGWEDIIVANGFVTGDLPGDL